MTTTELEKKQEFSIEQPKDKPKFGGGSSFRTGGGHKGGFKRRDRDASPKHFLEREILQTKRVTTVTKGGRQFSNAGLVLFRDPEKKSIAFVYSKGKDMGSILRKSLFRAKKKMVTFFSEEARTISKTITVKYKSTQILMKPTAEGNGIKAGGVLNTFFYYLNIKDVSAKIIGSRNKLNVIRAAFMAVSKLTNKKYVF